MVCAVCWLCVVWGGDDVSQVLVMLRSVAVCKVQCARCPEKRQKTNKEKKRKVKRERGSEN